MAEDMHPEQLPPNPTETQPGLPRRGFLIRTARITAKVATGAGLAALGGIDRLANPSSVLTAGEYFKPLSGIDLIQVDNGQDQKIWLPATLPQGDQELRAAPAGKVAGFFTTRTNGKDGQGDEGFWVVDDSEAPMYSTWLKYGGEQGLGLPITHRQKDPLARIVQRFQKAGVQLTVSAGGQVTKEEF